MDLGKSRSIWVKCLYSGDVVVFGQIGFFREKVVIIGKSSCNRGRWLY